MTIDMIDNGKYCKLPSFNYCYKTLAKLTTYVMELQGALSLLGIAGQARNT